MGFVLGFAAGFAVAYYRDSIWYYIAQMWAGINR